MNVRFVRLSLSPGPVRHPFVDFGNDLVSELDDLEYSPDRSGQAFLADAIRGGTPGTGNGSRRKLFGALGSWIDRNSRSETSRGTDGCA